MNIALIAAAGNGTRAFYSLATKQDNIPKQYQLLAPNWMILAETIKQFLLLSSLDFIQVIIDPHHINLYDEMISQIMTYHASLTEVLGLELDMINYQNRILPPCFGAQTRQSSIYNGLQSLEVLTPRNILIHDGARPFVSKDTIINTLELLKHGKIDISTDKEISEAKGDIVAVDTGVKAIDSLRRYDYLNLNRSHIYHVQTPQGFKYETIWPLHQRAKQDHFVCDDDIALCIKYGIPYAFVEGSYHNYKVTTPYDLNRARFDYETWKLYQKADL